MAPAIKVENLSKLYKIGTRQNGSYRTRRETIIRALATSAAATSTSVI